MNNKEGLRKLHRLEEVKEMTAMWNPGLDFDKVKHNLRKLVKPK